MIGVGTVVRTLRGSHWTEPIYWDSIGVVCHIYGNKETADVRFSHKEHHHIEQIMRLKGLEEV